MTSTADASQRAEALDPSRSFIVQAPAGSGKTELLIQRFLRLLARVERPEQIVAITFTRKAAAEMRQRVIATLEAAARGDEAVPDHRRHSLELGRDVLGHAERSGWTLVGLAGRLRITTIDALSTSLAQQLPVPASGIGGLAVTDKPGRLYALAARRATDSLADTTPLGEGLRVLLRDADNSLARLERWLAGVLPRRDSWLLELSDSGYPVLSDKVVSNLERLALTRLAAVRGSINAADEQRLFALLTKAGDQYAAPSLEFWLHAAGLLLKRDGEWRRRFTRADGFPADDTDRRRQLYELLPTLHGTPGLRQRLAVLAAVPAPTLAVSQRESLAAVEIVMPRLLAELRVLFEEQAVVDHTELALAAERALGSVDAPSELLLALDRRIEHILVDEFQDTSHLQWRLFEKLTAGWERGDGRTLFLVGDPMQSIYRFRDADLSLFLRAQRQGLGSVCLAPVRLSANHRSAAEVVHWVNSTFANAFPASEAHDGRMPPYHAATTTRTPSDAADVRLHVFGRDNSRSEQARVVEIVRDELTRDPGQSIGILVRSRSHVKGLRMALVNAGLPAHAVEIDSFCDTQIGQDLIGLTSALLHPGDRLSWLGVLRSPWCGLGWSDLLELCGAGKRTVWECLEDSVLRRTLSDEGRAKVAWLHERLQRGFARRASRRLSSWVRDCWLLLDGPAALANRSELELAERYFTSLEALGQLGDIDDPASLRRYFAEPIEGGDVPAEAGVEIMTMHRAKGLEFDTVLLPSLGRTVRGIEDRLLYNNAIYLPDGDRISLLAAASLRPDALREYLQSLERHDDEDERRRLLYVAATRARSRLHLIGSIDQRQGRPRAGSLLATLWHCLAERPDVVPVPPDETATTESGLISQRFRSLRFTPDLPEPPFIAPDSSVEVDSKPEFQWVSPASIQVGTLIHRELQRLAEQARAARNPVAPQIDIQRYRHALELLGVDSEDLGVASRRVGDALERVWADPIGRWILRPWPEAWSELRMTIREPDRLEHIELDRSFVDDKGVRWIIDYKTGRHLGGDPDAFLDAEVERYRSQLERYAFAVGATETRPIRVGLYFPFLARLRDWDPTPRGDRA